MMKHRSWLNGLGLLCLSLTSFGFSIAQGSWERVEHANFVSPVRAIAKDMFEKGALLVGTENGLYRTSEAASYPQAIFTLPGESGRVNAIHIPADNPQEIYLATNNGLYHSPNASRRWERIFQSSEEFANICTTVIVKDDQLYLGTRQGVFTRRKGQSLWQKINLRQQDQPIIKILSDETNIYMATDRAVYRLQPATSTISELISFTAVSADSEVVSEDEAAVDQDEVIRSMDLTAGFLTLVSQRGVFASSDHGSSWQNINSDSQFLNEATDILATPKIGSPADCRDIKTCFDLYLASERGAYHLTDAGWESIYNGLESEFVADLAIDSEGQLLAAAGTNIYRLVSHSVSPHIREGIDLIEAFSHEPSISAVQRMAVLYADVHPDKMNRWKKQARGKALLPDLSAGLNRADSEVLHWDTGQNPDTLMKGHDLLDWSVTLSWDLADLIWSTDQTTIDSRSKLMVELRDDILNQVTRLYFERRRLQIELLVFAQTDKLLEMDKKLRVDELTALIDALTGGEFTRHSGKQKQASGARKEMDEKY